MSYEQITTIEEAYKAKGYVMSTNPDLSYVPEALRNYHLKNLHKVVVIQAINEDWEPNYNDGNEEKREIWFDVIADDEHPAGSGLSLDGVDYWGTHSAAGARFAFKDVPRARHFFNHFKDLCEEVDLIR